MNRRSRGSVASILLGASLLLLPTMSAAQSFSSGSTGADGPFNPPANVPPGTTVNGSTYTVPLPPSGIFNFTTITVTSGITVTFTRNAANTPVILLATGTVTLTGTLEVSGSPGGSLGRPGLGGPGGFEGGKGADGVTLNLGGYGLGPGGGSPGRDSQAGGGGGGYATAGQGGGVCTNCSVVGIPGAGGPAYGNPALRPILGGSGGAGGGTTLGGGYAGGGGGGAVVLASSTSIALGTASTDVIRATGGVGGNGGGGGAGGAIRVIAPSISGAGYLRVGRGNGGQYFGGYGGGWLPPAGGDHAHL